MCTYYTINHKRHPCTLYDLRTIISKKKKTQILRKRNNQNFEKEIKFQILKKSYKIKIKIIKIVIFFHFKKILKKFLTSIKNGVKFFR
jgi:hypothetical protein